MNNFTLTKAENSEKAIQGVAGQKWSHYIAGGTNLVDLMKYRVENPEHLIDITNLPLSEITKTSEGGLRLGALATNADTAYHEEVEENYPLLSKAILAGASAQLRNMATKRGQPYAAYTLLLFL